MVQATYQQLPTLEHLNLLVGEWNLEFIFANDPDHHLHGREDFEWMKDRIFLVEHWHVAHPNATDRIGIIGANDAGESFTMHSFGSSGVTRIYSMSLNNGVWKLRYDEPGLTQRFEGKFSDDGNTITSYWERSTDGSSWERDFDLIYSRVAPVTSGQTTMK
ncbi:MAG: hypothetical protein GC204_03290 [Chloroflexi bacterium]|nr:hypothetical protein [Chloroflexota bacterium]